ncbi:hypothetical protein [aff. Roholtiella sp. LEGE 12411]|uniref:hypothetical protein n=1 Tax=aff. Roholtiella sp. LEGE 12411 TaxID=1828822 RepID=UPI00188037D8|nr:hypothetical protein [aff. Roholtiella sp. LEGE 12411]MBE9037669.1 hypothetical protein [aff. Roholtiella sp. LEGE 12411]
MNKSTIPGLHWYHVFWLSVAIYLLFATAAADGRFKLNHFLAADIWAAMSGGFPKLLSFQSQKAEELDKWSQQRWSMHLPNSVDCAAIPKELRFVTKQQVTYLNLLLPKTRDDVVETLGEPYCQLTSGGERWAMRQGFVDVEYNPVRLRLNADKREEN